jgi:hypothetical protein
VLAGLPFPATFAATQHRAGLFAQDPFLEPYRSAPMLRGIGEHGLQANANHRAQVRSNVFLAAALFAGESAIPVRLRNLSLRGALLEAPSLPPAGSKVRLVRGDLSAEGEIAWQKGGIAGLSFSEDIDVPQWVRRIGHRGQQRVDEALAALRAHKPARSVDDRQKSASLARMSAELDSICERLALFPEMNVDFAEELLKLDVLAQNLRRLSGRAE